MSTPFNPFQSGSPAPPSSSGGLGQVAPGTGGVMSEPLAVSQPPTPLLAVAGAIAVAGLVVAAVGWQSWLAIIGWALAGPLAIGVMGAFIASDTRRRAEPVYVRPDWLNAIYAAVAILSGIGIIVASVSFALWAGRL